MLSQHKYYYYDHIAHIAQKSGSVETQKSQTCQKWHLKVSAWLGVQCLFSLCWSVRDRTAASLKTAEVMTHRASVPRAAESNNVEGEGAGGGGEEEYI